MAIDPGQEQNIENSSFQDSLTQQGQAQGNSVQNQNLGTQFVQLIQPIADLTNLSSKSSTYYFPGLVLAVAGGVIAWTLNPIALVAGSVLFGAACYLCFLGFKHEQSEIRRESNTGSPSDADQNVYMSGVNYNDCIININGHNIDLNQDLSQAFSEIQDVLLNQTQSLELSFEDAKQQVIHDLLSQASSKPAEIRKRLVKLAKHLSNASSDSDEIKAADEVIEFAASNSYSSFQDPILVVSDRYHKLDTLLRSKQWEKADEETAKIILRLFRKRENGETWFTDSDIASLPRKDLNTLNKLWLNHSGERFGFSVQQRIWNKLQEDNKHIFQGYSNDFGDLVGWRVEGSWIYYSDLIYSLKAPVGHFPALAMIDPYSLQYNLHRFQLNHSVFNTFMGRQYNPLNSEKLKQ
ncbi:MAG: GUN4 domain-containing protein [Leptolyngbyaceae cyanobacterium RU_5_1]|nr:GUN4 domain-containing protein [Leptolyngbyaceae cyanobacterium RU_5_1]